ncbi:hypothetical protein NNA36_05600 [Shimia sp. CNT1-13L.2]|uniref:hypothetical protein n=1 Tax=Shimia sp. CNT1-13L.2 TaxID=2959663 RepID=UPI0020CBA517|nr:hypothetical protein [Shimia sp. CNT1-13L.2]MCP9481430.1 hypothetical protein [Shimia sp. CNT1-13L.2]
MDRDEVAYVEGAMDATIQKFRGDTGSSGRVTEIPSNFLEEQPGSTLTYTLPRSQMLGVRMHAERAMSDRAAWVATASASLGRSDYRLPNGAGVLVEPINIKFRTGSVDLAAGARRRLVDGRRMDLDLTGTAGVLVTHTKTHITSPVLDVEHRNTQNLPYVSAAMRLTPDLSRRNNTPRPFFTIGARAYPSVGARIVTELGLQF